MNLKDFAKNELELAGFLSPKEDFYGGATGEAVLELIEVFSKQGHSGMSADLVANLFWKLANHKSLSPITGEESEWKILEGIIGYQNKRCPSLFKSDSGEVTYGPAIVFVDPSGARWRGSAWLNLDDAKNGTGKMIRSSQKIKGFPFTPKTFMIDVKQVEVGEEIVSVIANPESLKEVAQYYLLDI